jgi:hypothetical protein
MEIYELLMKDHKKVQEIMERLQKKKGEDHLLTELEQELTVHMEGEEKFFYPALQEAEQTKEKTLEAFEEHHVTKLVLKELMKMPETDERWGAKLSVLKELVAHHVEEEEEELFKLSKKVLKKEQAQDIADKFMRQKEKKLGTAA